MQTGGQTWRGKRGNYYKFPLRAHNSFLSAEIESNLSIWGLDIGVAVYLNKAYQKPYITRNSKADNILWKTIS
jgi:hypothetical protein